MSTVLRVRALRDELAGYQPVESVGHGAGCDVGGFKQLTGREFGLGAAAAQGCQHVEFVRCQAMFGERLVAVVVENLCQPPYPAEHLERFKIQVWTNR